MKRISKQTIATFFPALLCAAAGSDAFAIETKITAPSKSTAGGDIAVFYARSTADESTSYFNESYGAALGLNWSPTQYTAFRVSTSLTREIGELEEKFRMSNTDITLAFPVYKASRDVSFKGATTVTLPTDEDDRRYLTYQGSVGLSGSVSKGFSSSGDFLNRTTLVANTNVSHNIFEYDASREGALNRIWAATIGVGAAYSIIDYLAFGVSLGNTRSWNSNGGRGLDRYRYGYNFTYRSEKNMSFRLEHVSSDRTFNYDRSSNNIALYDAEISSIVGTLTYDI